MCNCERPALYWCYGCLRHFCQRCYMRKMHDPTVEEDNKTSAKGGEHG